MDPITCVRCEREEVPIAFPPFPGERGERLRREICQECWDEWLRYQTMLINHFGLNLQDPEARSFLLENMEKFLYRTGETEDIDTSKEGTISW